MNSAQKKDAQDEEEIVYRNSIVKDYSLKNKIPYFDTYELMKNSSYAYDDPIHFERASNSYISYSLLIFMWQRGMVKRRMYALPLHFEKIMIYGKGVGGQEIYWWLKWLGIDNEIFAFVESECRDGEKEKLGISIISIKSNTTKENVALIISSDIYEEEMRKAAKEYGWLNIFNKEEFSRMLYKKE